MTSTLNSKVKQFLFSMLVAGMPLAAQSQHIFPANTGDREAHPQGQQVHPSVANTGTDVVDFYGEIIQVMVWDGDSPNFTWSLNGDSYQSIPLGDVRDPDVVVAEYLGSKDVFAIVVYINKNDQVEWKRFDWVNNKEFVGSRVGGVLGTVGRCSFPNIDVNKIGFLAITWQETVGEEVEVTIKSPTYGINTYTTEMKWEQVHGAQGYINGTNAFRTGTIEGIVGPNNQAPGVNKHRGDLVPELILGSQNSQPDVAVANYHEPDDLTREKDQHIFYTYTGRSFDSSDKTTVVHGLLGQQENWRNSANRGRIRVLESADLNTSIEKPRIAAKPNTTQDSRLYDHYEVAAMLKTTSCKDDPTYSIFNYGLTPDGGVREATLVNPHFINSENKEPVITFRGGDEGHEGDYVIAWAVDQDGDDVLARTYNNGNLQGNDNDYSLVNSGDIYVGDVSGVQRTPSIAGRNLMNPETAYLFYDEESRYIGYKISGAKAGQDHLRVKPNAGTAVQFEAYPNPASRDMNINYALEADEKGIEISITDVTGRIIERIDLSNEKAGNHSKTLSLKSNMSNGLYFINLRTSKRAETLRMSKVN